MHYSHHRHIYDNDDNTVELHFALCSCHYIKNDSSSFFNFFTLLLLIVETSVWFFFFEVQNPIKHDSETLFLQRGFLMGKD